VSGAPAGGAAEGAVDGVVYLNGRLVRAAEARVSVFDRGFLYGDGVFETVRAYGGRLFMAEAHFERLRRSAAYAGIALPFDDEGFTRMLLQALGRQRDALVRVTVTRGEGPPVPNPAGAGPPTVLAVARPAPDVAFEQGIALATGPWVVADGGAKTLSYLGSVVALAEARRRGADEAVRLNPAGEVAEGSVSNLFGVWSGTLSTPPPEAGILAGVTRAVVLDLARRAALDVAECTIRPEALAAADELFVTSTGWEVMPVTRLDGVPVGGGKPGPVTARLAAWFRAAVEEATQA
jgi:branched-chain amino acid aminotransferase